RPTNRVSSILLFGAVALAPMPFGSVAPTISAGWCVVLGTALLLARPGAQQRQPWVFAILGVVLLAYAVVVHEQTSSSPWFGLAPDPVWGELKNILGADVDAPNSTVRNQPLFALGGVLVSILAFATAYVVCADRERGYELLNWITWSGTAVAAFGI